MSCNRTLPDVVPAGVREVYGYNLGHDQTAFVIGKRFFLDQSWQNITALHLSISKRQPGGLMLSIQPHSLKDYQDL